MKLITHLNSNPSFFKKKKKKRKKLDGVCVTENRFSRLKLGDSLTLESLTTPSAGFGFSAALMRFALELF